MKEYQHTIRDAVSLEGVGLHTGIQTKMTFKPAPVNHGIRFVRIDLPGNPEILAVEENVVGIARGTNLKKGQAEIMTIEHVLAAVSGLQIDNIIIEVTGKEVPVLDGSSIEIVKALKKAGIVQQNERRIVLEFDQPLSFSLPEKNVDVVVVPSDDFRITFMIEYPNTMIGSQYTFLESLDEFETEFAPARTFCFLSEVQELRKNNLIKGGDLDNAVVVLNTELKENELDELKGLFNIGPELKISENGILNNTELRFYNECVRHKVVDLVGDLALLGMPIKGHLICARSGHYANVQLVRKIKQYYDKQKIIQKYQGRKKNNCVLDINAIQKILPHRYPFLLVDRITKLEGDEVVGLKNVTINEPFFQGHFPGQPIMPGVLQLEAMGQVGGILLLNQLEKPEEKLIFFTGMDSVKFRKTVVPGDQIIFTLKLTNQKRNFVVMKGTAEVNGNVVCEAVLKAAIVDRD